MLVRRRVQILSGSQPGKFAVDAIVVNVMVHAVQMSNEVGAIFHIVSVCNHISIIQVGDQRVVGIVIHDMPVVRTKRAIVLVDVIVVDVVHARSQSRISETSGRSHE